MEFNSQSAVAIARLTITIAAAIGATFGWSFDADLWFNVILSVIAVALLCYSWWKNNNITEAAQESQKVLMALKRQDAEYVEAVKELQAKEVEAETSR